MTKTVGGLLPSGEGNPPKQVKGTRKPGGAIR